MKNTQLIFTVALLALMATGCAKEYKADGAQVAAAPTPAPVVNPTFPVGAPPGQGAGTAGDNWAYGGSADFKPDSLEIFNTFVAKDPLNNPTNVKINVNLTDIGGGRFAGAVKLAYDDVSIHHEGYFMAAPGKNNDFDPYYGTAKDVGLDYATYNYWFQNNKYFSGYFQDTVGAVVLVVDNVLNQGDAQGGALVSGSLWFKNFTQAFPVQGINRYCWFLYRGPYMCRSNTVMDKSSPYPSDGYRRLGTFTQLLKSKAFNQ
jgi:hypothetical protein